MCVFYITYLKMVGMGSKLARVLRGTHKVSYRPPNVKTCILKIRFFNNGERKMGTGLGTETDKGNGI
jgi:hypothetical protein